MARLLGRCPICDGTLHVTEISCARCRTQVRSQFENCRFCRLPPEQLAFIELFLRCEGNLRCVEKELKISYPTVRNRLMASLEALGLSAASGAEEPAQQPQISTGAEEAAVERRRVLEAVSRGEIATEEAVRALRALR